MAGLLVGCLMLQFVEQITPIVFVRLQGNVVKVVYMMCRCFSYTFACLGRQSAEFCAL